MNPTDGGNNSGAGQFPALGLGMDPFTSSAAGGDQMSGGFVDSSGGFGSYDDPANVVGDPFFDPVFGSEMMGGGQEGFPGQTPYVKDPDQKQEGGADPQQQGGGQQEQIPDAAGGPRQTAQPQGPFGGLSPLLKQLASAVTGNKDQGAAKQGASWAGKLGGFLSGGQMPQKPGQQGQQGQQDQTAPQGTEGGGAPQVSPPTQGAPPPTDQGATMSPRPPIGAAFPTTLSHLAQAQPGPTDAGPTPPQAAAPDTGAGPGAAPGQAAPGAAPDSQLQAITGSPEQNLRNLLEGNTTLSAGQQFQQPQQPQQPQQAGEFAAPTPQVVAQSRLAGTDTAPTAGFSPYLAQERAPYVKELDNPRTALRMAAMMSFEHENDPVAVAESLMNRTKYTNTSLDQMLSPRFYGPMRKPRMFARRMAELQRNPQRMQKLINAAKTAGQGTNLLGGATDQGSGRDPNVNHRGGRVIRHGEVYNDWGGGPGGHAGAQRFRQEQQQRVRGGQQEAKMAPRDPSAPFRELEGQRKKRQTVLASNETTGQAPPQPQRVDPNATGDVGAGAGALPQPSYIDAIQRMHNERNRRQGIQPRGDILDWLTRQAMA